ncbi:MAG TPA: FliM/FliN family flagellar motor switch protein [Noviherbaspirillum sp.]|nr:FliM/FliN family flagellar motor switch protein [Noviherbaspirillum sp.]
MNVLSSPLVADLGTSLRSCLPTIEPQVAAMLRVACSGRNNNVKFQFGGVPFQLRVAHSGALPEDYALALQLKVGPSTAWLFIESYDIAGEEWAGILSRLDPQLAQALLIEESSELLARLTRAGGSAIQLAEIHPHVVPPLPAIRQLLEIQNMNTGMIARAALCADGPEFFDWLAREYGRAPWWPVQAPVGACLPIRICVGKTWLAGYEVETLEVGDVVIMLGMSTMDNLRATCIDRLGFRLPFKADLTGRKMIMTFTEEKTMSQSPNEMRQPRQDAVALEDVLVPITAVIGEVELPLRAMASLQAGYVFELPTSVEEAVVHLYTGSARVGQGRLITVGNMLGVQVLEWGGKKDGESA